MDMVTNDDRSERIRNRLRREIRDELRRIKGKGFCRYESSLQMAYDSIQYMPVDGDMRPLIALNEARYYVSVYYSVSGKNLICVFDDIHIDVIRDAGGLPDVEYFSSDLIDAVNYFVSEVKVMYGGAVRNACLFTGAFNPPTIAHYHMAQTAYESGVFDYVVMATANKSFLKKKQRKLKDRLMYSENDRMKLLMLMTRDCPHILVYGIEEGYTYDVLNAVRGRYETEKLYFACGSDKLCEIECWGHAKALLTEFCFYVSRREEDIEYVEQECSRIFFRTEYMITNDDNEYRSISATDVRTRIQQGGNWQELVHPSVIPALENMKPIIVGKEER